VAQQLETEDEDNMGADQHTRRRAGSAAGNTRKRKPSQTVSQQPAADKDAPMSDAPQEQWASERRGQPTPGCFLVTSA
jgi:hypothetical protein